jgi:hypothetical protein
VPRLKRAASAPGLSLAVACDRGYPLRDQKLYVVNLRDKTAKPYDVPPEMRGKIGLNNPAVAPDGAHVFTQGGIISACPN